MHRVSRDLQNTRGHLTRRSLSGQLRGKCILIFCPVGLRVPLSLAYSDQTCTQVRLQDGTTWRQASLVRATHEALVHNFAGFSCFRDCVAKLRSVVSALHDAVEHWHSRRFHWCVLSAIRLNQPRLGEHVWRCAQVKVLRLEPAFGVPIRVSDAADVSSELTHSTLVRFGWTDSGLSLDRLCLRRRGLETGIRNNSSALCRANDLTARLQKCEHWVVILVVRQSADLLSLAEATHRVIVAWAGWHLLELVEIHREKELQGNGL